MVSYLKEANMWWLPNSKHQLFRSMALFSRALVPCTVVSQAPVSFHRHLCRTFMQNQGQKSWSRNYLDHQRPAVHFQVSYLDVWLIKDANNWVQAWFAAPDSQPASLWSFLISEGVWTVHLLRLFQTQYSKIPYLLINRWFEWSLDGFCFPE